MATFVKKLSDILKEDSITAGGKAASLGEMIQNGFPVPPGFVILVGAFQDFLQQNDLIKPIKVITTKIQHDNIKSIEKESDSIQALFRDTKIPNDVTKEIMLFFEDMGTETVAVRSSAAGEDGTTSAWAGQFDTFLNTNKDNLLINIKNCWASLYSSRAIVYRFRKNLDASAVSAAIVIQKMVNSEISGIAFSAHPVTQDRNQIVIEAGLGLGEGVVSGRTSTDMYIVNKTTLVVENEPNSDHVLSKDQILELTRLVVTIEQHWGFPCDIEWALEKNKSYILQSRPITTLKK